MDSGNKGKPIFELKFGHVGTPDYLPPLRGELLEVIKKYVNVDPDAVTVNVERDGEHEVLEPSVALPEHAVGRKIG